MDKQCIWAHGYAVGLGVHQTSISGVLTRVTRATLGCPFDARLPV
jgi:hypothetical protein